MTSTERRIQRLERRVAGLEGAIEVARRDLALGARPSKVAATLDAAVNLVDYDLVTPKGPQPRQFNRHPDGSYVSGPWRIVGTPDKPGYFKGPWRIQHELVDVIYEGRGGSGFPLATDRYTDAVAKVRAIEAGTFTARLVIPPALRALQVELEQQATAREVTTAILTRSQAS